MENHQIKRVFKEDRASVIAVRKLLEKQNLTYETTTTEIYGLYKGKELIGTGSLFANVLKMIAIDDEFQGTNAINKIMSYLINKANENGEKHLFIYTTPLSYKKFEYFGFSHVVSTENIVLLENVQNGFKNYIDDLGTNDEEHTASIVMNCNPFTLGHRYLIERASKENKKVYVFILWENLSSFPNDVRFNLVKEGVKDLKNVNVLWAKDYMISSVTFPAYFLNDFQDVIESQTLLDVEIFGKYIAPKLMIKKRYIGQEPLNPVTQKYNDAIKKHLPKFGIEVEEIDRIEHNYKVISASTVRRCLIENRWNELKEIVPEVTLNYLKSKEAYPIIEKLIKNDRPSKLV